MKKYIIIYVLSFFMYTYFQSFKYNEQDFVEHNGNDVLTALFEIPWPTNMKLLNDCYLFGNNATRDLLAIVKFSDQISKETLEKNIFASNRGYCLVKKGKYGWYYYNYSNGILVTISSDTIGHNSIITEKETEERVEEIKKYG